MAFAPDFAFARRVVRDKSRHGAPEALRMVHLDEMRHFVRDHVIDESQRHLNQAPVEMNAAAAVATAPARAGARKEDLRRTLDFKHASKVLYTIAITSQRLRLERSLAAGVGICSSSGIAEVLGQRAGSR